MTALSDQLRRFHAIVTGREPLEHARTLVEQGPLHAVDAVTRMRVYAHAYTARIAGVLAFDYPKLDTLLPMRELVDAYLRAHPPAHPSLREVGRQLARFLAARGDAEHLVDLARLERARTEAFDGGADTPPLGRDDVAALDAADFPSLALKLVPSSYVVELSTNADDIWDAIESEREPPAPVAGERVVLVWRRDVTVIHRTLEPDEARIIRALAAGTSFAGACELVADHPAPAQRAMELLVRWLDAAILAR